MKHEQLNYPLVRKVHQFIKKKGLLHPGQNLVVAVSGGIDSVVMLDALVQLREMWKYELAVAHVNFQLRGKESDKDEKFVKQIAERYGLPFHHKRTKTKKIAKEKKQSLQEAARDIRYSFFDTLKKSLRAVLIVTGHNADDNAETMILNLLRGSGIDGLAGIPVQRESIIRPMLCVSRKEIVQYAKKRKLKFREDSSNSKDDYTRNYLRNNVIPKLEKRINPALNETLFHEAELFRSMVNFADNETEKIYTDIVTLTRINTEKLSDIDPFIKQSIVRRFLKDWDIEPSYLLISAILDLQNQQKGSTIEINKKWIAERQSTNIEIRKKSNNRDFLYKMENEGTLTTADFILAVKKSALPDNKSINDSSKEYVDASKIKFPLTIRSWQKGDVFIPLGMNGKKKVSDFFGEQKLESIEKKMTPIVESNGTIVWIAGKRLDERYKLTDTTTETYQLSLTSNGKKNDNR